MQLLACRLCEWHVNEASAPDIRPGMGGGQGNAHRGRTLRDLVSEVTVRAHRPSLVWIWHGSPGLVDSPLSPTAVWTGRVLVESMMNDYLFSPSFPK